MRRLLIAILTLLVLAPGVFAAPPDDAGPRLTVMTRNVYVGFDVTVALDAIASGDFVRLVTTSKLAWDTVRASDFHARAQRLADEIADTRPEIVGLQEVALFRSQEPADFLPTPNAETVDLDFLQFCWRRWKPAGSSTTRSRSSRTPTASCRRCATTSRAAATFA